MKKLCIGSLLFIIVIFAAGIINIVNPNKPSVSLAENRKLQEKPVFSAASFFDKSYVNNYSAYYSDTFILRDTLIQYRRAADKFFGFKKNMKIEISKHVNTPSPSSLPVNTVTYSPFPSPANTCTPTISQTEAPPSPTASVLPAPSPTPKPEYRAASTIEVLKSPFFLVDNNVVATIWAKDESLKKYAMFIN